MPRRANVGIHLALAFCLPVSLWALPPDFVETTVGSGWNEVIGLTFDPQDHENRVFVWERGGRVWIVENGVKLATPFIDINDEVGGWRDYGLLGFALHPNYHLNGHVYLLYVVDRHHLLHAGTPSYNPAQNEYFAATIGRITRYTAIKPPGDDDFGHATAIDPNSRLVLLGETASTGFPILHQSHGVGGLIFGTDGTLIASCGDGASYSSTDTGSASETYYVDGLADGIIRPDENVGAYRSQMLSSLSGKIVRLDPDTGDGLPSNPFWEAAAPRSARSRVWSLGLRNPCRIALRPNSGSHTPSDGNPGSIYIGDVGWQIWEDLHVATAPGQNFGWPAFEGLTVHSGYFSRDVPNEDAPNPLFGVGGCTQEFFYFNDLIQQDTLDPNPFFPNPCDPAQAIPGSVEVFLHTRPAIDWRHGSGPSRTGIYDGLDADVINIGAAGSPVAGPQFGGNSAIGGVWYTADDFPAQYKDTYFHADYSGRWIRNFVFDGSDQPVEVRDFLDSSAARSIVYIATHPQTGGLYYVDWNTDQIFEVAYAPGGNQNPTAVASADVFYGPTPLTVQFTGSNSSDPEGAVTYEWDFGDGSPISTQADPSHQFTASPGVPTQFDVVLTVTDSGGATDTATVVISLNNTPPSVTIDSPVDGTLYSMAGDTPFSLTATISDAEHSQGELTCAWQTFLIHNDHDHRDPVDPNCSTSTVISPAGCDGNIYFYRIFLTVSDAAGLSTTTHVRVLPDCGSTLVADAGADQMVTDTDEDGFELVTLDASASNDPGAVISSYTWLLPDSTVLATGVSPQVSLAVGDHEILLEVINDLGHVDVDSVMVSVVSGSGQPPTAAFTATPTSGEIPLTVQFDASGSFDTDGTIVSYDWTFGDGGVDTGVTTSHEYTSVGDFTATLTVTDNDGFTDSISDTITVNGSWWDLSWSRRHRLTFNNAAQAENLVNFPVLVTLDATRIDYSLTQAQGEDLRFIDADGFTVLSHEIESWDPAGTSHVWVKVPQIDAGSTTDHMMLYYDNASAPDGQDAAGVWSAGYAGVWHLDDFQDSTSNANDGVDNGTAPSAGRIGSARSFDGVDDFIDAGTSASLEITGQLSIEAWIRLAPGQSGHPPRIVSKKNVWNDPFGYNLEVQQSNSRITSLGSGSDSLRADGVVLGTDTWHYIATSASGTTGQVYLDGVDVTTDSTMSSLVANPQPLNIGRVAGSTAYFLGVLDEVRISSVTRSAAWIAAQHQSMSDGMLTYGVGEGGGRPPPTVSITSPADGTLYVEPVNVTIEATASDPEGTVDQVDFYADGGLLGSDTTSPYEYVWNGVPVGTHSLTAVATNDGGVSETSAAVSITVDAAPSPPSITQDPQSQSVFEGETATFDVVASGTAPLSYQWLLNSVPIGGATSSSYTTPVLTLADDGGFYSVEVSNAFGSVTSADAVLTVLPVPNDPPTASFTATPESGLEPLLVSFDASGSSDTDGTIVSYSWDFGDTQGDTGVTTTHEYASAGTYLATLTVTDDDGDTDSTTTTITVSNIGWWDASWGQRRQLTFNNAAQAENLVDFPVLVTLDATRIDYSLTQAQGEDIRFIDADGFTVLSHEIESWDPAGTSHVWVKVPQIDASSTTDYMMLYYDNASAPDGQDAAGVWSAGYAGVWHLDGTQDSTSNANDGVDNGTAPSAGRIGSARSFDGVDDFIDAGTSASLEITGQLSIEAWIRLAPGQSGHPPRIVSKKNVWNDPFGYNLEVQQSNSRITSLGSGSDSLRADGVVLGTDTWHYIATSASGTTGQVYLDGVDVTTDSTMSSLVANPQPLNIGRVAGSTAYFLGVLDEVRISSVTRSAAWIAAQHQSMSDGMLTYGVGEGGGRPPPTVSITSPADGTLYVEPVNVTIEATASDPEGTVDQVDFYADGGLLGSDTTSPYEYVWNGVPVGTHSLTAVATNDGGVSETSAAVSITVDAAPSPPSITQDPQSQSVFEGETATFDVVASGTAPLSYQWLLNSVPIGGATSSSYTTPVLTLADDGGFYSVEVSNAFGSVTSADAVLTVLPVPNDPPTASFTATPESGLEPLLVSFDASGSSDTDGTIVSYSWDFGDTQGDTGVTTTHEYASAGTYLATLTVTDDDGDTDSTTTTITVSNIGWWDASWGQRRQLTFNNAAQAENLVDFPVLVTLDATRIDYSLTQAQGEDLRFIDADSFTVLSHEIESWDPAGTSHVWVKVPQIDASSTTDYMMLYYDNGSAPDGQDAAGVWSAGYAGVWHLDGTQDSTSNANDGVDNGTAPGAGRIGGARTFDGVDDFIDAGTSASLEITGQLSIEAWIRLAPGQSGHPPRIVSKKNVWNDPFGYNLEVQQSSGRITSLGSGSDSLRASGVVLGTDTWHYVATSASGTSGQVYLDGVDVTTDSTMSSLVANPQPLNIGRVAGSTAYFLGVLDEVRISSVTRSAAWIAAQHQSMSDGMLTYGVGEGGGRPPPTVSITSPADGTSYVEPVNVTIEATASDPEGTVDQVDFYADGGLLGSDTTAPYEYVWNGVPVGTHSLTAVATNDGGVSETSAAVSITVDAAPSPPSITQDPQSQSVFEGETATFDVVASGTAPLSYQWLLNSVPIAGATSSSYTTPVLTLADDGGFYSVEVSNAFGSVTSADAVLTVLPVPNDPPTASFTATPESGLEPLLVSFDASGSSDTDGTIVSYSWDFGDTQGDTGVTTTHEYASAGTYLATLTVTDDDGDTDSATTTITVSNIGWWDASWGQRRQLTFNNAAQAENLVDFPVLVTLDATKLDYAAIQAAGEDLRFIDDDGTTVLSHEIDTWDPTGTSYVWVRVPQIDAVSSVDYIMLYYDNPVAPDGQDAAGVWTAGYNAVWHLNSDLQDSTANINDGVNSGSTAGAGQIGAARSFDGVDDFIDAGTSPSLEVTGQLSIEAWFSLAAGQSGHPPRIVSKKNVWNDSFGYNLEVHQSSGRVTSLGSGTNYLRATGLTLSSDTWYYVATSVDGGTGRVYLDGVDVTADSTLSPLVANPQPLNIGRVAGSTAYFLGLLDEVRISGVTRSAAWIAAQHLSMSDNFITFSN